MRARTIYLIKRLEVASRLMLEAALKDLDLTPSRYAALSMLSGQSDVSCSDLARRAMVAPQSMAEIIVALDRKALITRRESEVNRRVLGISLSPAGLALLKKADDRVDLVEAGLFSTLSACELQTLRDSLASVLKEDRRRK